MNVGLPTPEKLRQDIVRAFHEEGLSYQQITRLLGIGQATASRVLRLHRETGRVTPRPRPGRQLLAHAALEVVEPPVAFQGSMSPQ
jgi:transposase